MVTVWRLEAYVSELQSTYPCSISLFPAGHMYTLPFPLLPISVPLSKANLIAGALAPAQDKFGGRKGAGGGEWGKGGKGERGKSGKGERWNGETGKNGVKRR